MIIGNSLASIGEMLGITDFVGRIPDSFKEPSGRVLFPRYHQVGVPDHIQQDQGLDAVELFLFLQLLNHLATTVSIIVTVETFAPFGTNCFFTIKENKSI